MPSLEQLRTVPTRSQALQWYLDNLGALGFNTARWVEGSQQHTLLKGLARVTTNFAEIAKQIVEMCFNDLARGAALEAYSISRFGNTPKPATKAKHTVRLTNGGAVPHAPVVGQLVFSTDDGVQFRSTTGGTVRPNGGTLDITVECTKKGSIGNVEPGAIKIMVTPLAGVTATNPAGGQVSAGEDAELDAALRQRNRTKWSRLTPELVRDSYINIALEAHPSIRRADCDDTNPRGAGTIDIYIAGDSGASTPTEIEACQNAMAAAALQTETYPASDATRALVRPAPAAAVRVAGTVYYDAARELATVQANVEAAIRAFIALTPLGGYPYPSPGNLLPKNNLERAIIAVSGVRTVTLTEPAADVPLAGFSVAVVGSIDFVFEAV
ncbi:MAG TPA: baseplate J/gp47 family protein [Polyangiaceae bacterium]|nr:baseplate J/gp47 family protein [Polyangiaceae bacterium]